MATTTKSEQANTEAAEAKVKAQFDKELEQGYRGVAVDPTPNENYTVAGVTAGKPTPETDEKAAAEARKASRGE